MSKILDELQDRGYITQVLDNATITELKKFEGSSQSITKHDDYLYEITMPVDYELGFSKVDELYDRPVEHGACTSVRFGNCAGRNYDWKYDDCVSFVLRTPHTDELYASIGIACNVSGFSREPSTLVKEFVESGKWDEEYMMLPFNTKDGINEKGVHVSLNVVPAHDIEKFTTGTNPNAPQTICSFMLSRWILDHYDTAAAAVSAMQNDLNIWAPKNAMGYETHYLISDANESYIVEFWNNEVKVIKVYGENTDIDRPYMTNFYIYGTEVDESGNIVIESTTPSGAGIERYNYITAHAAEITNSKAILSLLGEHLKYTNTYREETVPTWNSEFAGFEWEGRIYTNRDSQEDFQPILDTAYELFKTSFERGGEWWQTVHTSVYDFDAKELHIISQEQGIENVKSFSFNDIANTKLLVN